MIYNRQINRIMRNKVLLFALASIMMSLGIPTCAQQSQSAMKAGDVFTGTVTGRFGPIAGANIREYGSDGYIMNIEVADSLWKRGQSPFPHFYLSVLRAWATAASTSVILSPGSKRFRTLPSVEMRNLVKFQRMLFLFSALALSQV